MFCTFLLFSFSAYAQQIVNIQGNVTDAEDGLPLMGVTVSIDNLKIGTVTDSDGNYSLSAVPVNATITFSYLGYGTEKIAVKNRTQINLKLSAASNDLNEVVVIGYGAIRKRDVTSSIAKVSESDIDKTPVMSLDQALQGNAAGVTVINTSAEPGGDISIRIRGGSSILAGNTPLIVVDGFPATDNEFSSLNPSDVVSMEVLKDASATAIYGSRGANGVILITTKKGVAGKPKFTFQSKIHYTQVRHKVPLMNGPQHQAYANIGRQTMGSNLATLQPDTFKTRDFQDMLILPHTVTQDYNASLSGGNKEFSYLLSANVLDQPGLLINSSFRRTTLRGKFNVEMTRDMRLQVNVSSSNTKNYRVGRGDSGPSMRTLMMNPTMTQAGEYVDGLWIDEETGEILSVNTENAKSLRTTDLTEDWRTTLNADYDWKLFKYFTLQIRGGYQYGLRSASYYLPAYIYVKQSDIDKNNITRRGEVKTSKWINENTLTFMRHFDKHHLTAMVGQSWESTISDGINVQARGLDDSFLWQGISGAKVLESASAPYSKYNLLSYYGRVIYNYGDRYLTTLTNRADGSSRFGKNSKWGHFPSASFAWVLTEEKFIPKSDILSNLKLRVSYGLTGNDKIGSYRSWTTLSPTGIVLDGNRTLGYIANNLGDPLLGWEETSQANAGFDLSLFKRIFLTVDVYDKYTKSLLYNYRLPNSSGYETVSTNIGSIRNRGVEVEFSSQNITGRFEWKTDINVGYNRGKITDLGGDDNLVAYQMSGTVSQPITYLMVGQPIGTFKGYQLDGVYKDWNDVYNASSVWYNSNGGIEDHTQPGYHKYVDRNNDGVIDEYDKVVLGHAQPDWTTGITNTFTYKNFDLTVFFNGAFGNSIVNINKGKLERYRGNNDNQVRYVMDGYRPMNFLTGDPGYYNTGIPRAVDKDYSVNLTNLMVEDGSYFRLKTISLGYTVPKKLLTKIKLRTCKLQISGMNLATWTRYTGMDPEASSSLGDSNNALGIDQSSYPASRSFVFNLTLGI